MLIVQEDIMAKRTIYTAPLVVGSGLGIGFDLN
jgi:hypothetical protein